MLSPDVPELTRCMAAALRAHIIHGDETEHKFLEETFDERVFPLTKRKIDLENPPSERLVHNFIHTIFKV